MVRKKRGDVQLSFGMIFSIILIIAFLAFGFYAIKKFISFQQELKYTTFLEDFQSDIETVWRSTSASQQVEYSLPSSINSVCIIRECTIDYKCSESDNIVFLSKKENFDGSFIKYLNTEKILEGKSEACINVIDGKIKFILKKDYNENLVTISLE